MWLKIRSMARASAALVLALRETALRLERQEVTYKWSHFAHCNCGQLAQTITRLTPEAIYRAANHRSGDWGQQAERSMSTPEWQHVDYGDRPALDEGAWEPENVGACPITGERMDTIFARMQALGLDQNDIYNLERLSDSRVRRRLGMNTVEMAHYRRENVVAYLQAWADLLEESLPATERQPTLPVAAEWRGCNSGSR